MKHLFIFYIFTIFLWAEHNYTNALIKEDSPYLQQHAHNPVNWFPWGEEAFEKAKKENKLIFLSIGYSTCHWCHVMEEESFTDRYIAQLLNQNFISIKVDREEYSQIDNKYQKLYMQMRGKRGGWPLSVFMTSKQEVFHLTTYIPKEEGYGVEGMVDLLPSLVSLQKDISAFQDTINSYKSTHKKMPLKKEPGLDLVSKTVEKIAKEYDSKNGGFATRPKFPEASKLALLLDSYTLTGNKKAFEMAEFTLKSMAEGGIYDQIGGGFFRYSTDYAWHTPHFEKMLYTNAELIPVYVKLYEMTHHPLYKKVVDETIIQMEKVFMQEGVYFSATDADSDGEEGGYFIYEYGEIKSALKDKGWTNEEIEETLAYLGIEEDGNVDGESSLARITSDKVPAKLGQFKSYLKSVSDRRSFPFIDKKINTAWNAMMVKALFVASQLDSKYESLAVERLDTLLKMMRKNEVLHHQALHGKKPTQKALLEDYAFLIDALIAGYERTYEEKYLQLLQTLSDEALTNFYRQKQWYLSDDGLKVKADFDDRHYTSALSQMLENLLRVTTLTDNLHYASIVKETMNHSGAILQTDPQNASKLVHVYLRLKKGDIIIHARKEKLLLFQDKQTQINYPFVLSSVQESDEYLACKTTMCFASDRNITKLIEKINKVIE